MGISFIPCQVSSTTKKLLVKGLPTMKDMEIMTTEINTNPYGEITENKLRVPYGIRPDLSTYRFEILMWGVRQMQRIDMIHVKRNPFVPAQRIGVLPVNQPRISIDIAGYRIESDKITDWSIQPNFEDNLMFVDLVGRLGLMRKD